MVLRKLSIYYEHPSSRQWSTINCYEAWVLMAVDWPGTSMINHHKLPSIDMVLHHTYSPLLYHGLPWKNSCLVDRHNHQSIVVLAMSTSSCRVCSMVCCSSCKSLCRSWGKWKWIREKWIIFTANNGWYWWDMIVDDSDWWRLIIVGVSGGSLVETMATTGWLHWLRVDQSKKQGEPVHV